jgi:hypothetical protein
MAKNKKPAKKYRPKYSVVPGFNPVEHAIQGARTATSDQQLKLRLFLHDAMHNLTHGKGSRADWDAVKQALNVSRAMANHKDGGSDYIDEIEVAMKAHLECGRRKLRTGNFGYSAQELQSVNLAIEVHEAQMAAMSRKDFEMAVTEVERAIKHRGPKFIVESVFNEERKAA